MNESIQKSRICVYDEDNVLMSSPDISAHTKVNQEE